MSEMATQELEKPEKKVSRREFLKYGAVAAAVAASSTTLLGAIPEIRQELVPPTRLPQTGPASSIEEITIAQIQSMFAAGTLTAASLVNMYLSRISALDQSGPRLNSILQTNPDALSIAQQIDQQRQWITSISSSSASRAGSDSILVRSPRRCVKLRRLSTLLRVKQVEFKITKRPFP